MLIKSLDDKLKTRIDIEILRKKNKKKFNINNTKIMSIGWIFTSNIFTSIILGCLIKKYLIDSNLIFVLIIIFGITLSFLNLIKIIKEISN